MRILLFTLFILCPFFGFTQIVINEYSASNESIAAAGATDFFGNNEDYIEIYNTGATPVNLYGYYFSDNAMNITKWQINIPVTINPNSRMIVYCSGKDTIINLGGGNYEFHPDFKLTQCHNEKIIIADASSAIVDSLTMVRTQNNQSRGRTTDGANTWGVFTTPNPDAPNGGSSIDYLVRPSMSVAPGFYTTTQSVSLSTTSPNSEIRYTTNGSVPTTTSTLYTGPINVAATTVIRARTFPAAGNTTYLPSFTETNTYFINVNHNYAVVSVCGNYTNGLFITGQPERTSVEYFDPAKNFKWETDGYARKHGHDSWAFSQKGFRLHIKDEMGYLAEMPEKFFANTPRDSFKVVILKAAASDNYPDGPNAKCAHMRDAFCHTYSIKYNLDLDERSYIPAIVYINGQYWGVYEIRERVDDDYTEYYYNQDKQHAEILRYWGGYVPGTPAAWIANWNSLANFITTNNMAVQSNYNIVDSQLNLSSMIDNFILNTYLVNSDWLNWNTMWWRGTKGNGVKWRYVLWDEDNIMGLGQNYSGLPSTGANSDPCQAFDLFQNSGSIKHTQMLSSLMANPGFQQQYKSRYAYLLTHVFTCDSLLKHLNYFEALLTPEMNQHINKWGGSFTNWQSHVDSIRSWILSRCSLVGSNNDTCLNVKKIAFDVYPAGTGQIKFGNTVLTNYVHRQVVDNDTVFNIEAIPAPGYRFVTWQKQDANNIISPSLTSKNAILDYKKVDSIVAIFEVIPPDTFNVVIDAKARYAGLVNIDGTTNLSLPNYPYTTKMIEKTQHYLKAAPADSNHKFVKWTQVNSANITSDLFKDSINIDIHGPDTLIAWFDTVIHMNYSVTIPNAFSPNGDGKNDFFRIDVVSDQFLSSAKLQVFNRYDEIVFSGNAIDGWNGVYKDEDCESGTYFYVVKVIYTDKAEKTYTGDLTLIR